MADEDQKNTQEVTVEEEEKEMKEDSAPGESSSNQDKKEEENESEESVEYRGSRRAPFVSAMKASPFWNQVSAVLHWHDPVQSALIFGIGNFFFFLITYGEYSVLTLLSYLGLALILVCGAYVNGTLLRAHFKKETAENPFSANLKNPYQASKYTLEPHADCIIGIINDIVYVWTSVLYFTDTLFSLRIAVLLCILSVIGKLFSGTMLLYMTFLTAFIWPRIYQEKQVQIDQAYELAMNKVNFYSQQVLSKLPLGKKKKTE